jgi:tetratricopeptide (TPR) repeat protein
MRRVLPVLMLLVSVAASGQTAQDYFNSGLKKHKAKDYEGAIKEYKRAIKVIPNYRDAYYNMGTCEMELKNFEAAQADFTKVTVIDPKYAKAYFSRAYIVFNAGEHEAALPDLDTAIQIDFRLPNALTLRGQIRAEMKNYHGACEDFYKAKAIGDKNAADFIAQVCK